MRYLVLLFYSSLSLSVFSQEPVKYLRDFSSINLFDEYLEKNKADCLDKSLGGTRAVSCFSAYYQAWDTELNYYYNLLRTELNKDEKQKLKLAQLAWIKSRDATIEFNSVVLDRNYADKEETMFVAMRSGDVSKTLVPIIKKRALLLKKWHEVLVSIK